MAVFEYQALDQQGKKKKGTIEGESARHARQLLRDNKLTPTKIESIAEKDKRHAGSHAHFRSISNQDLTLFTRQMATLSKSGMPLEEVLQAVAQHNEKKSVTRILLALRANILEGRTLASACEQFPKIFPSIYSATVAAGESSGKLDLVLERLSEYLERREEIRRKIQIAMIYPAVISIFAILVVSGLLTFVVPQIIGVFENQGAELPTLTKIMIQSSDFLRENGLYLILGFFILLIIFRGLLRIPAFKLGYHGFILSLPLIGRFSRGTNAGRFVRTLAILTTSGVELLEALKISSRVVTNLLFKEAIDRAISKVKEGGSLSHSLSKKRLFPPIILHLISTGEASGNLSEMLSSAADNQEKETEANVDMLVGIFEPLLVIIMGLIVFSIVIAILLPIFNMNQILQ